MNKLLKVSVASALVSATSLLGQIEINENLSVTGFLDMSVVNTDSDVNGSDTSYNLDQAELDFLFSFDDLTAQIDLNYLGDNDTEDFDLEQAFITYDLGEGSAFTAGKFLSFHGWETAEPTGLYQYSYAYDLNATIPGYFNGVSYSYDDDFMSLGVSLVDSIYDIDGSLTDSEYGVELKAAFFPAEGLTLYFGYANDNMDEGDDKTLFNFWASYEINGATYAIEYNTFEFGAVGDAWPFPNDEMEGSQWLIMGNWPVSDNGSVTARIAQDTQDWRHGDEATKYTLSYLHTVTDNLALVTEFSSTDFGTEGDDTALALEALFTF